MADADIDKALDCLEDDNLTTNYSRCHNYQIIQKKLEDGSHLADTTRLLTVCNRDLKEDMKNAVNILTVVSLILRKLKNEECSSSSEVVESARAILHMIKTTAHVNKVQALQKLCFDTFMMFPDSTYAELVTKHCSDITEVINLYMQNNVSNNLRLKIFDTLHKLLKALPSATRHTFVKDNISIWFSRVIPTMMTVVALDMEMVTSIDVVELLVDDLGNVDYQKNEQWQHVLECISSPQKYPAVMTSLLKVGNDCWWRIWKLLIRLLKQQTTMIKGQVGSPINSMLPVVEQAFKMDAPYRCRAFQCWSVLIDNFSMEINEKLINKRVKLLIIPLKSNNAKVENVALAKFHTWWHLIEKYHTRMGILADMIYIPFLHFCFGNPKVSPEKNSVIPGQLSLQLKKLSVQALVESAGHIDCNTCEPCTAIEILTKKILTPKLLVNHLTEWLHALKAVINYVVAENNSEHATKQIRCFWKSLLIIASKLPKGDKNSIAREILNVLTQMIKAAPSDKQLISVIVNVLIQMLLDEVQLRDLLVSKDILKESVGPLHELLTLTLQPAVYHLYPSSTPSITLSKLKPLTLAAVDKSLTSPDDMIEWLIQKLPLNDIGLMFWTSLAEAIMESKCDVAMDTLKKVILWPLTNMEHFENVQTPAAEWNKLYTSMRSELSKTSLDKDISLILLRINKDTTSTNLFSLYALLPIVKDVLGSPDNTDCKMEAELLVNILSKAKDYEALEPMIPVIVDSLVLMLTKATDAVDGSFTELALNATNFTLKLISESKRTAENDLHVFIVQLLKQINKLFKNEANLKFKYIVCKQLISSVTEFTHQDLKDIVGSILQTFLGKETDGPLYTMVKDTIANIKLADKGSTKSIKKGEFPTPKGSAKKSKKKEPSVVSKVKEDGEEFEVIKSHWKFNPKKLTENQKEKLQRKREDIPALYQDLSQSQDEFRLASWKTDSQDTSVASSTSKSTSRDKDDASTVLKKMPSTDVVPNIMDNIFSNSAKETKSDNSDVKNTKTNKIQSLSTLKPESSRIALKDRVSRNVKVLQKSLMLEDFDTNICNVDTPSHKSANDNEAPYSAPPKLSADRPSRIKRKPKKYEIDFLQDFADSDVDNKDTAAKLNVKNSNIKRVDELTETSSTKRRRHSSSSDSQKHCDSLGKNVSESSSPKNLGKNTEKPLGADKLCSVVIPIDKEIEKTLEAYSSKKDVGTPIKRRRKSVFCDSNESISDESRCLSNNVLDRNADVIDKCKDKKSCDKNAFGRSIDEQGLETSCLNESAKTLGKHHVSSLASFGTEKTKKLVVDESIDKEANKNGTSLRELELDDKLTIIHSPIIESEKKKDADATNCVIMISNDEFIDNAARKSKKLEIEITSDKNTSVLKDFAPKEICTPIRIEKPEETQKSKTTGKKRKKSRIEKELAIDMIEGHPLFKDLPEKRTRKSVIGSGTQRKALTENLSKLSQSDSKVEARNKKEHDNSSQNTTEVAKNFVVKELFSVIEIQDNISTFSDSSDLPLSEDFIESSQDTTISVKPYKSSVKKTAKVVLENNRGLVSKKYKETDSSEDNSHGILNDILLPNNETEDDVEFTQNKSVPENNLKDVTADVDTEPINDLTANMDTEPMVEKELPSSDDVIIINDDPEPIVVNTDDPSVLSDTQNTANADTESLDANQFSETGQTDNLQAERLEDTPNIVTEMQIHKSLDQNDTATADTLPMTTNAVEPKLATEEITVNDSESGLSSPFKDEEERNQDFLNSTQEISPIKTMCPIPETKPGSPETSSDYVVITLSSPVSSNGEPFDKSGSPEIFTEDKVSPDKRDQSPPRKEVAVNDASPSSSLSLKKNRPQIKSGNRAAQMLGLCVPDKLQTLKNIETPSESEEHKNAIQVTTPARRNLRILYNCGENNDNSDVNEHNEDNFLKFKRTLPSTDSSPSGPILKRKYADMDDCASSPASKRKRVSFHDPPVSTTIAVHKYIEPLGIKSPQSSILKKLERQPRSSNMKSPKKLENIFILETALNKTVESFCEATPNSEDIDTSSMEQTPSVEVVKTSELNDTDPICPELLTCSDPISNIASELSSPAMKNLLIQELEGKVETIGDLAKLTELEVNRLCIKAPKVKVARKVLSDYSEILKQNTESLDISTSTQTNKIESVEIEMQTESKEVTTSQTQTKPIPINSCSSQTEESGSKTTEDVVRSCILERPDFVEELMRQLNFASKMEIIEDLSLEEIIDANSRKIEEYNKALIIDRVIEKCDANPIKNASDKTDSNGGGLQFLTKYLSQKYSSKDLVHLSKKLLQTVYENFDESTK